MLFLRLIYLANIFLAGTVGYLSYFHPERAAHIVFSGVWEPHPALRLVGAWWLAITLVSLLGLWKPYAFSATLLIQWLYKAAWLVAVAWPAWREGKPFPEGMAGFFLLWVLVLPWAMPWKHWWEQ